MSLLLHKRLAVIGLLLFAAWPLIQYGLVTSYDMDPWRFFGWAMYTVPKPAVQVSFRAVTSGRHSIVNKQLLNDQTMIAARREFRRLRQAWGQWHPPDQLGQLALEQLSDVRGVEVIVHHYHLEAETAYIRAKQLSYLYCAERWTGPHCGSPRRSQTHFEGS